MKMNDKNGNSDPSYELDIDSPGFKYEEVKTLRNGKESWMVWAAEKDVALHKLGDKSGKLVWLNAMPEGAQFDVTMASDEYVVVSSDKSTKIFGWVDGSLQSIHEFSSPGVFGTFENDESIFVGRLGQKSTDEAELELFDIKQKKTTISKTFPHNFERSGPFKSVEISEEYQITAVSSDGSMHMFNSHNDHVWHREESIAHASSLSVVELPDSIISKHLPQYPSILRNWWERLKMHIDGLSEYSWLMPSLSESEIQGPLEVAAHNAATGSIETDLFGFRKLLVFLSPNKIVALDSKNHGRIVWARYIKGLKGDLHVVDGEDNKKLVVVVDNQDNMATFHALDALTGQDFFTSAVEDSYIYFHQGSLIIANKNDEVIHFSLKVGQNVAHSTPSSYWLSYNEI